MKTQFFRFTFYIIIVYLTAGTLNSALAAASNLNVGEPRTVRVIYFLPSDRPYRAEVVQEIKDTIRTVQTFYADQMEAYGYGKMTFRFKTDPHGDPMVHRVDGAAPLSVYNSAFSVWPYLHADFYGVSDIHNDPNEDIYLIFIDSDENTGGRGGWSGKTSGWGFFTTKAGWKTVAHELGHAFRLHHDFRDNAYIMSYGNIQNRLSSCHAEYLSVHPYFNPDVPVEVGGLPTIELISSHIYPADSKNVPVQLKLNDSDGFHQVFLLVRTRARHSAAGYWEVKACRSLEGEKDTIVEFDYDGVIPSEGDTSLSYPRIHNMRVEAVDTKGDQYYREFMLVESTPSPHRIATRRVRPGPGLEANLNLVSFSPDGTILVFGSADPVDVFTVGDGGHGDRAQLWDMATWQNIADFEGNFGLFSPDGTILVSWSFNGMIKLWDVATQQNIFTVREEQKDIRTIPPGVPPVSFSPDGTILAYRSNASAVKLLDVATRQDIATLGEPIPWLSSLSFSPDGSILAVGKREGVQLWDVATQVKFATLGESIPWLSSLSFSPDGSILAVGKREGVQLWDVTTQVKFATFPTFGLSSLSFSPDGNILAVGTEYAVQLWDVATQVKFATFPTFGLSSLSFSPDGNILAVGKREDIIELWDTSESDELVQARVQALAEVDIPDPNLRTAIATELGKQPSDPIREGDLADLVYLSMINTSVSDFTGLEFATNLRTLDLSSTKIGDISALAKLTNLTKLYLMGTSISDISALAGLTQLRRLDLSGTSISDISALAKLTHLTRLYLSFTSISDISALAGLTNLIVLNLDNTSISDISALAGLTHLTRLYLSFTSISDISALEGLTNLAQLWLVGTSISDISALAGLTNLGQLDLSFTSISDISPLVANTGLGSGGFVYLWGNPLSYQSIHTHIPALQRRGVDVRFENRAHPALLKISGDNQKGAPLTSLAQPFVVEVQDENGSALAGVSVTFTVTSGGGTLSVTRSTTDANGRAESILTLGPTRGTNTVTVSADGIASPVTFYAISEPDRLHFTSTIPAGISLFHVPLQVEGLDTVGDLRTVLGAGVSLLTTYDGTSWHTDSDDVMITADLGILVMMTAETMVTFEGTPWDDGTSTVSLQMGTNLIGLPVNDPDVIHVSDIAGLFDAGVVVSVIVVTDAGHPSDGFVMGDAAYLVNATTDATATVMGDGWSHDDRAGAAPMARSGYTIGNQTPVLNVRGAVVDEITGLGKAGFRVQVQNLSTRAALSSITVVETAETGYNLTFVDLATSHAARVGDVLEISVDSPDPRVGVNPVRHIVTVDDVKRSRIQLEALIAYEIPAETALLRNYPNPFNPETWIPYRLASDADVSLTIYDSNGVLVRRIDVGHQTAAVYESRSKAIYWDGRNRLGAQVASGIYFYTLMAGDYVATRKMVILK